MVDIYSPIVKETNKIGLKFIKPKDKCSFQLNITKDETNSNTHG